MNRRVLLWWIVTGIVIFCQIGSVFSQTGDWTTFNTSTTKGGLANDDVRAIAVDGDYIWFGTYGGGLCDYQKSTGLWTTYDILTSQIISDYIQVVATDGDFIWIGTDFGVSRYNRSTIEWTSWDSVECVSDISVDWDIVWITTVGFGVYYYEKFNDSWGVLDSANCDLISNVVTSVNIDGENIWFGTKSGVSLYNKSTGDWQSFTTSSSELASNVMHTMAIDGENIWFGHSPGLSSRGNTNDLFASEIKNNANNTCPQKWLHTYTKIHPAGGFYPSSSQFNRTTNKWNYFEFSRIDTLNDDEYCYPVYNIAAGREDVWFAAAGSGVYRYHKATNVWTNFNGTNSGLSGDWVWTIAIDANYVWIGTYGHGVSRYSNPPALWKCYRKDDGLADESVEAIDVFGDEAWFGTHRGISRLQISNDIFTTYDVTNSNISTLLIWAVGVDSSNVWIGPALTRYQKEIDNWAKIDTAESQLGKSTVRSIAIDENDVWIGATNGKICRYQKESNNWTIFDSSITKVKDIIYDIDVSEEEIWFGCLGGGAGNYNKVTETWTVFDTTSGLVNNTVSSVGIDSDYVWIGTFGGGISRYQKSTANWVTFDAANTGQPIYLNYIWTLAVDGDFLWFGSHSRGVYRYEKSTNTWENFNQINSPLSARRVYDIKADGQYVWISAFDTDYSVTPIERTGGVCRYGDVNPPEISHTPITIEQPSAQPVLIITSIKDNVAVKSSFIYYRLNNNKDFNSTSLYQSSGDSWYGQIPAADVNPGIMEYYLTATDDRNTATHPYTSAINSPHRFSVYDSVLPIGLPTISSPINDIADNITINVNISIDGTGSKPWLDKVMSLQYDDYATENIIDSSEISLTISWEEEKDNKYSLQGTYDVDILNPNAVAIKLRITISDQGHDELGNPQVIYVLSNPLFKFTAGASMAKITEPDFMEVVTGIVTIKGIAYDENLKQYNVSYRDSLNNSGVIQSSLESRTDAVLAQWNTENLSEGKYAIILAVENIGGDVTYDSVTIILDNTYPQCEIINLENNMVVGGNLAITGTATDKHFDEYHLEYGVGINPMQWDAVGGLHDEPVTSDTLGSWKTLGMDGYHAIRLRVIDKAGLQSIDTKNLILDNTGTQAVISEPQDQEIVTAEVKIQGTVIDENFKSYTVEYCSILTPGIWVEIFSDTIPVSNGLLATWNTDELNGQFWIRLKAEDRSSFIRIDSVKVIVDNLQPVAEISRPNDRSQVGEIVSIEGTAYDENFAEYILEWGPGENPEIWTKITSTRFTSTVQDDVLTTWNASGKRGIHSLQLTAGDRVGYQAKDIVIVDIIDEIDAQSGGCILSPDSLVEICLPADALSDDILVTINRDSEKNLDLIPQVELLCPVYRISPVDQKLEKPGTLIMTYTEAILSRLTDKNKLAITRWSQSDSLWEIVGGTMEPELKEITAAIHRLDCYSLTEAKTTGQKSEITEIDAQPRIFAPQGNDLIETIISFHLGKDSNVSIKVFNLAGRLIRTLCENRFMTSGSNIIAWDGKDSSGKFCVNGLYMIMIQAEKERATKTVMVLDK